MRTRHRVRQVGNLVNLSTPLGLLTAAIGRAKVRSGPRGLLLAEGYRPGFPIATAFTIGNVLIHRGDWDTAPESLLGHEEVHSWQWFCCLGLPFLPAYLICTGWSMLRTGNRATGNFFERQAGLEAGGYLD
ncbi:MAG TPA: hypothetical protein VK020_14600 [Microlunatus sp.]|nr:hypothetical protein [Microlunatus sp.]